LMHILGHFPLSMFKKAHNVSEADSPSVIRWATYSVGSTEKI
jgi:hypothetical protein